MQRQKFQRQLEMIGNPISTQRQLSMLLEMGLEDYEIQYLLHQKLKEKNSRKWM